MSPGVGRVVSEVIIDIKSDDTVSGVLMIGVGILQGSGG